MLAYNLCPALSFQDKPFWAPSARYIYHRFRHWISLAGVLPYSLHICSMCLYYRYRRKLQPVLARHGELWCWRLHAGDLPR